ncbi:MAG: hypothetical protein OHK0019_15710 [Saprospiraceae bacterium]
MWSIGAWDDAFVVRHVVWQSRLIKATGNNFYQKISIKNDAILERVVAFQNNRRQTYTKNSFPSKMTFIFELASCPRRVLHNDDE